MRSRFVVQRQKFADPRFSVGAKVRNENRTKLGEFDLDRGGKVIV